MPSPDLYQTAGAQYGVDPLLLRAVAQVETGGTADPDQAVSNQGAVGRMQMEPATAAEMGVADPTVPAQAIPGAARYLVQGYQATGTPAGAVLYYHGGPDPAEWGPKTRAYLAKVTAAYQALRAGEGATGAAPSAPVEAAPARPSDAAMATQWGIEAPTSPVAASAPETAPARPSDADMETRWGIGSVTDSGDSPAVQAALARARQNVAAGTEPASAPVTVTAAAPPAEPVDSAALVGGEPDAANPLLTGDFTAGIGRGVRDVTDPAREFVANKLAPVAQELGFGTNGATLPIVSAFNPLLGGLGQYAASQPPAPVVQAQDANALAAYNAQHGDSGAADIGRVVGQTAATVPLMLAGGALVRGVGELAGAGLNAIDPSIANAGRAVGNFLTGGGGSGIVGRTASRAVAGAGQGAVVNALTSGQSDEPLGQQLQAGALTGALAGGVVGPALAKVGNGVLSLGSGVPQNLAELADTAINKFGIPIRVDQVSGSQGVRKLGQMVSQIPGSGLDTGGQLAAWRQAVSRTFGENTADLTPQVMSAAKARIGGVLNAIESTHNVTFGNDFVNRLADIERNAESSLTAPEFAVVKKQLDGVLQNVNPGDTISGETFGNLIHKGSPLDAAAGSRDSNIANYAEQIEGALRDAMQTSLPPADQAVYQNARYQYKNMMTVAPLVVKGAPGEISPALLQGRIAVQFKDAPFSGGGDLGQLAQIGQTFLKGPQDSGTPLGLGVLHAITRPGALVGEVGMAGLGGHLAGLDPLQAAGVMGAGALGAGTTLLTNRMLASALKSPAAVRYLVNSGLAPRATGSIANALTGALIGPYSVPIGTIAANRMLPQGSAATP